MTRLIGRFAVLIALACGGAHAAPLSPDPTGFWYDPNESGWGISVEQQDDIAFAALFVYDPQGRPEWLVASKATDTGDGSFSGTLYRTSGPWFGGPFDPHLVQRHPVGSVSMRLVTDFAVDFSILAQPSLQLDYTVDGVAVHKEAVRMTWGSNAPRLVGAYLGGTRLELAPLPQPSRCAPVPAFFPPGGAIRINLAVPDTIAIIGDEALDTRSLIAGTYGQSGQLGLINASLFAGPIVAPPRVGEALLTNVAVTDDGFTAHLRLAVDGCAYEGAFGGIRRPPGG